MNEREARMVIREMHAHETEGVQEMMRALWPDAGSYDFDDEIVFVCEKQDGGLGGFISVSVRPWADGCESEPVAYIEGWWVAPELRKIGVGRALIAAAEQWAKSRGFCEIGSDTTLDNVGSIAAHQALGFEPTEQLQLFRKRL